MKLLLNVLANQFSVAVYEEIMSHYGINLRVSPVSTHSRVKIIRRLVDDYLLKTMKRLCTNWQDLAFDVLKQSVNKEGDLSRYGKRIWRIMLKDIKEKPYHYHCS